MNVSKDDVRKYLRDVKKSIVEGRYIISPRPKNQSLYLEYVFSEERCKEILLDLKVDDFSDSVRNDHPQHPEEILYIFGTKVTLLPKHGGDLETVALYVKINKLRNLYVIVVSFHKQEYSLTYKFK